MYMLLMLLFQLFFSFFFSFSLNDINRAHRNMPYQTYLPNLKIPACVNINICDITVVCLRLNYNTMDFFSRLYIIVSPFFDRIRLIETRHIKKRIFSTLKVQLGLTLRYFLFMVS